MTLIVGFRLGHYDVTALIGEGGMGQVYQATDTKLNQVALKILPEAFAKDPDRLARFQREAQVLASLNHPGIAAIYGLEESDGVRALVLELVEGPTLADRIAQGAIPVDEALPIAKQIAEALEAAHEAGVIHRDLKPANIKVREDGTVKVLDFGLAKALDTNPQGDPSQSPTLTAAATQMGVIMGTAAYMSPEQARGKPVDRRADVWSFGAVLFEMLTGQRAFAGEDLSLTLSAVLQREPDWETLPPAVPLGLSIYLRRCLHKDPTQRIQAVGDLRLAIDGVFETTTRAAAEPSVRPQLQVWQRPTAVALIAMCAAWVAGFGVWATMGPQSMPAPDLVRFAIVPPNTAPLNIRSTISRDIALFPDGTQVVYRSGTGPEGGPLYLRSLDQLDVVPLRGADGRNPFVSPDGEWVGFVTEGNSTMQKISTLGGPPVMLAESPRQVVGASWGGDDQIIFGTDGGGLLRVSGGGGEPDPLTTVDSGQNETAHMWPFIIPGRGAVVFVIVGTDPLRDAQLAVLDLGTGDVTRLGLAGVSPHYVSTGHLVYATEDRSLRAVPFDATSLEITGDPVALVGSVVVKARGAGDFSVSDNGSLVYVPAAAAGDDEVSLVWVDRAGDEERIPAPPRSYGHPRVSPDGARLAVDITDGGNTDVWIWDLERETLTQFTFDEGVDDFPLWTPDGARVVFGSTRDGGGLFWKAADGTGQVEPLKEGPARPYAWAAEGQLLFEQANSVGVLTMEGERRVEMLFDAAKEPAVSPSGRWLAYVSIETEPARTFGHPFPNIDGGEWVVSSAASVNPVWSADGRALFYRARDGTDMMVAHVEAASTFSNRTPEPLFSLSGYKVAGDSGGSRWFDLAPDGDRFVMLKRGEDAGDGPVNSLIFVENWHLELLERVPVP